MNARYYNSLTFIKDMRCHVANYFAIMYECKKITLIIKEDRIKVYHLCGLFLYKCFNGIALYN